MSRVVTPVAPVVSAASLAQGKRQSNNQRRSEAILRAALQTFASAGFHGADVQVIADEARVGKGTVYRHYGNKEALFLATARWCVEQVGAFVEKRIGPADELVQRVQTHGIASLLLEIAQACGEFYREQPAAVEMMIMERAEFRERVVPTHLIYRQENRQQLEEWVSAAIAAGHMPPLYPAEFIDGYADLIFGSVVNGCLGGNRSGLVNRVVSAVGRYLGIEPPSLQGTLVDSRSSPRRTASQKKVAGASQSRVRTKGTAAPATRKSIAPKSLTTTGRLGKNRSRSTAAKSRRSGASAKAK